MTSSNDDTSGTDGSLRMPTPYDIITRSSFSIQSTEEWATQIEQLRERVCKIEEKIGHGDKPQYQNLRIMSGNDLYESRIDYSNDVIKQWNDLRKLLSLGMSETKYTGAAIIVNARIFFENESRLMYKGYRCEPVPFTHCTIIHYVGGLQFTMHLDSVD